MAATSLARPTIERASPRFGFTSTSSTTSPTIGPGRCRAQLVAGAAQQVDPLSVVAQPQLDRGAQHAVRLHAADLRPLDPTVTGEHGADHRHRHQVAGRDVVGATICSGPSPPTSTLVSHSLSVRMALDGQRRPTRHRSNRPGDGDALHLHAALGCSARASWGRSTRRSRSQESGTSIGLAPARNCWRNRRSAPIVAA